MLDKASKSQRWPTTHWSLIGGASQGSAEEQRQALTLLVKKYLPALRWHLLARRRIKQNEVDDFLQEFLLSKILLNDIIRLADARRGRFRTFLATALDRFIINKREYETAAKRSSLRRENLEEDGSIPADNGRTPSEMIDYYWGRQVLGQAIRRMRVECSDPKRADLWTVFRGRVLHPIIHNSQPIPFAELAKSPSVGSAARGSHLLETANRTFVRSLRSVIGAYDSKAHIDDEIRDLWRALSKPRRERK